MERIAKITDVRDVDDDFRIIRGNFKEKPFWKGVTEDVIIQIINLNIKDIKIGNKIKIIEKENKIFIVIDKSII